MSQRVESYIADMGEALVPYGTVSAMSCHAVLIELKGPWADFAIPDGIDSSSPSEMTWSVLRFDLLRIYIDLADLDEDKVLNHPIFSLEYIRDHKKGTPYVANTPTVTLFTKGLNTSMTVHTVDLDKVDALRGERNVPDSQLGLTVDTRKSATVAFSDQQHADAFQKAIQKAIVLCKAQ